MGGMDYGIIVTDLLADKTFLITHSDAEKAVSWSTVFA